MAIAVAVIAAAAAAAAAAMRVAGWGVLHTSTILALGEIGRWKSGVVRWWDELGGDASTRR